MNGLEEDVVDYGTVGTGENRTKLLKIFNNNPIEVRQITIYAISIILVVEGVVPSG